MNRVSPFKRYKHFIFIFMLKSIIDAVKFISLGFSHRCIMLNDKIEKLC